MGIKYASLSKGERLWIARRRNGENQATVAKRFKVREQVYRIWEQGDDEENCPGTALHPRLTLNEQIALARRRKGISIKRMAKTYGISHVTIISWERDAPEQTIRRALDYWDRHGWPEKPIPKSQLRAAA